MTYGGEALSVSGLTCVADGRTVLDEATLNVAAGQRVALMGPSGAGKTTMLTALAGLIAPARGRILVRGVPLDAGPAAGRDLAIILQGYGLVSLLTAAENVEIALRAAGRPPGRAIPDAAATLDRLGLAHLADHLVDDLSGGQQQRVAVARGIALSRAGIQARSGAEASTGAQDGTGARRRAGGRAVLLADEPTAEQDPDHRAAILRELSAVAAEGTAVIIATHDPDVAAVCDRVVRITDAHLADDVPAPPR